jgi:16S rRNA (cytosine967-C5)-methyltransferase
VVQDAASALVAPALGVAEGDLVLDLAAGPGGKSGHLAALGARVIAVELNPARARMVRDTARRLGIEDRLLTVTADGARRPVRDGSVDAVLVDAPCSNLGSLRRRPEARWRHGPDEVRFLAELQGALLDTAVAAVRPGGQIVYSVCTWNHAETDEVVDAALERHPGLEPAPLAWPAGTGDLGGPARTGESATGGTRQQFWPHRHASDGIFVARLRKIH